MSGTALPVLVVEDTDSLAQIYLRQVSDLGYAPRRCASLAAARAALAAEAPAAILLDVELPDGSGLDLLPELRSAGQGAVVVVITAHGSVGVAVEAMRAGADDFLVKPFSPERLGTTLRNGLERRRLERIVRDMSPSMGAASFEGFIGADLSMQAVYRMVEQAARSKATVFITGESGTGKEVCAEAIHRRGARRGGPFVAINCGAIPRDLLESEVFGHVRGAFTGATADRIGAARQADGGTLFLDEICEMDLALQSKLLRFLQTGTVQPVGAERPLPVDARIVCATNRDPLAEVQAGRFREDLYYRLHVVPLHLPPLRDRGDDVLLIARHMLAAIAREEGRGLEGFTPEAETMLLGHSWPGNVRELQNVLRRVVVLNEGRCVTAGMLPAELRGAARASLPRLAVAELPRATIRPLAEVEREAIEQAIALCEGNMTEAARQLGVNVSTIYRKRQAWGTAVA